jgi:hypothetical protein
MAESKRPDSIASHADCVALAEDEYAHELDAEAKKQYESREAYVERRAAHLAAIHLPPEKPKAEKGKHAHRSDAKQDG